MEAIAKVVNDIQSVGLSFNDSSTRTAETHDVVQRIIGVHSARCGCIVERAAHEARSQGTMSQGTMSQVLAL
jgi:hypothetical protein